MLTSLFSLQPLQRTYLTVAMNRVSRSFALVVPWLEEPLQEHIAAAYLLCRTLDNIEDCGLTLAEQSDRFIEFSQLLANPTLAPQMLQRWEQMLWPGLTADETMLMTLEGGLPLWQIFAAFPISVRTTIAHWITLMAQGMASVLDSQKYALTVVRGKIRVLRSAADYNDYCYHVAGTVGGMGTELVIDHYGLPGSTAQRLLAGSEACGRALQKTNIVKDFAEDLARGICYLPDEWLRQIDYAPLSLAGAPTPWTYQVVKDVLDELSMATDYVLSVPQSAHGYRIACLMCLFPAYQTLLTAAHRHAQLFTVQHEAKISRAVMAGCIHDAVAMATDDDAIQQTSRRLEQEIQQAFARTPVPSL